MAPPTDETEPTQASVSGHLRLAVGLTAIATLLLGILPSGILSMANAAWRTFAQQVAAR
jgi:hypothetical protein